MPDTYSYSDGTISLTEGSAVITGIGTAWSTQAKVADFMVAIIADSPPVPLGFVGSVDSDLQITLQDAYQGGSLDTAGYRLIRGIAWWTGAAPNETLVSFLTELKPLGLAGVTAGVPDPSIGRENELRVDFLNDTIYQKRTGTWYPVAGGFGFDAYGYSFDSPSDRDRYDAEAVGFTFYDLNLGGYYVKLSAGATWSDLIEYRGPSGREIELQTNGNILEWRYAGDAYWTTLYVLPTKLESLENVGIDNPVHGDVLRWNSATAKWENDTAGRWIDLSIAASQATPDLRLGDKFRIWVDQDVEIQAPLGAVISPFAIMVIMVGDAHTVTFAAEYVGDTPTPVEEDGVRTVMSGMVVDVSPTVAVINLVKEIPASSSESP